MLMLRLFGNTEHMKKKNKQQQKFFLLREDEHFFEDCFHYLLIEFKLPPCRVNCL